MGNVGSSPGDEHATSHATSCRGSISSKHRPRLRRPRRSTCQASAQRRRGGRQVRHLCRDQRGPGKEVAIVGGYRDDDNGPNSGSAYLFDAAGASPCPWDLDAGGRVGITDLLTLLDAWGTDPAGPPDFDGVGDVRFLTRAPSGSDGHGVVKISSTILSVNRQ